MLMLRTKSFWGVFAFVLTLALLLSSIRGIISVDYYNQNADFSQTFNNFSNLDSSRIIPVSSSASYPSVSAHSALLLDTVSGDTIFELNSRKRLPMASTTKIMTAIVALESGVDLNSIITVTKAMTGAEGSSMYLYVGERFVLLDLIYALMLNSANDSAEAIAVSVAGSIDKFAAMMNDKVRELNLTDTNFKNPHGLDSELHYTTAYDLAKISAYALENETFYEITKTQSKIIYPKNSDGSDKSEGARFLRNHNKMLRLYKDAVGVKTGFTRRSGRCLVSAAERDGTRLVAVTINAGDDWNDHAKMLDYGFDNYKNIELCKENEYIFEIDAVNGYKINQDGKREAVNTVKCANIQAAFASLPKSIVREDIEYRIELPRFIYAPVKKGDIVGRVVFTHDAGDIAYSIITASEDIETSVPKKSVISRLLDFFR